MRDFKSNDRVIGSELRSALVDAPERATYVVTDTNPIAPTDLEVGCEAGTVVIDGDEVSVSAQAEDVSDISGEVTETAYRYHTLSVDDTGTLVVRSSDVGEFDADDPDAEPITQVTEPSHETGEAFLGTAFQVDDAIERVFDGRYVLDDVPNSVITQGEGSALDADLIRGNTPQDRFRQFEAFNGETDGTVQTQTKHTFSVSNGEVVYWYATMTTTDSSSTDDSCTVIQFTFADGTQESVEACRDHNSGTGTAIASGDGAQFSQTYQSSLSQVDFIWDPASSAGSGETADSEWGVVYWSDLESA